MHGITEHLLNAVDKGLYFICGVLIWAMVLLVTFEISIRTIFDTTVAAYELQLLFFAYCTGQMVIYAFLHDRHVRVSLLTKKLSPLVNYTLKRIHLFLIAALSALTAWKALPYLFDLFRTKTTLGGVLDTPSWIVYLVPSVMWLILFLVAILFLIKGVTKIEDIRYEKGEEEAELVQEF